MNDSFLDWLAGFIDGEGCFVIGRKRKGGDHVFYNCEFRIKLREDDTAILYEISEQTGIGRVMPSHTYGAPGRKSMMWLVYRKDEVVRLVEILDAHPLRAKKRRDYEIWREAVSVWTRRPIDWPLMADLHERLISGRQFVSTA